MLPSKSIPDSLIQDDAEFLLVPLTHSGLLTVFTNKIQSASDSRKGRQLQLEVEHEVFQSSKRKHSKDGDTNDQIELATKRTTPSGDCIETKHQVESP